MEILLAILVLGVALAVQIVIATTFSGYAEDKGHNGTPYFWACFFLGVVGCCMVASLPDLTLHDKLDRLNATTKAPTASSIIAKSVVASDGSWTCGYCGTKNSQNYGMCKKCGKNRS